MSSLLDEAYLSDEDSAPKPPKPAQADKQTHVTATNSGRKRNAETAHAVQTRETQEEGAESSEAFHVERTSYLVDEDGQVRYPDVPVTIKIHDCGVSAFSVTTRGHRFASGDQQGAVRR